MVQERSLALISQLWTETRKDSPGLATPAALPDPLGSAHLHVFLLLFHSFSQDIKNFA